MAIIAVIVAISASDPLPRTVCIAVNPTIEPSTCSEHSKSQLALELQKQYLSFPEIFRSYRVLFKMINCSNFDLKEPVITFELDKSLQRPAIPESIYDQIHAKVFHSNLYGKRESMVQFWSGNKVIMANNNFPFWNRGRTYEFWIEMVIDEVNYTPFEVLLSINCDNAEGMTKSIMINPANFLKKYSQISY